MTPPNALAVFQHLDWSAIPVEQIAEGVTRQMVSGDRADGLPADARGAGP